MNGKGKENLNCQTFAVFLKWILSRYLLWEKEVMKEEIKIMKHWKVGSEK